MQIRTKEFHPELRFVTVQISFYRFVKGGDDQLNKIKRETIFINLLETLPQAEAEILILAKDKALGTKYGITQDLVTAAWPEITWGNRS